MRNILNKIGKTMTAMMITIMSVFSTATVMMPAVTVSAAESNILDNIKMDNNGKLNTGDLANSSTENTFNGVYDKYKAVLNGVIGLVTITLVLLFVIQCGKLGAASDNAMKRSNSIGALLWIGIAAGLLGAVYTFIGLFYNLFNG